MRWILLLPFLLIGCSTVSHRFGPVGEGATNAGRKAPEEAYYPLDKHGLKGNLRLRSEGYVDLKAKGDPTRLPALHLSVTIVNTSEQSWRFDTKEQSALFPNQGQAQATPLKPEASMTTVAPGESKKVDLYFRLPGAEPERMDEFDVKWTIRAGEKAITDTTTFARLRETSYPGYTNYGTFYDWGPRYYYRPSIRVRR